MIQTSVTNTEILAMEDGKLLGKIEFSLRNNEMSILHTYAYESGRGIGSMLMSKAVEWANEHSYKIVPSCSFAKKYLDRIKGA